MKKKVFLATAILALMTVGAYAQSESDFVININNGKGVSIIGYNGSEMNVNIPAKINNLSVSNIAKSAFEGKNITSVTIPKGISSIGRGAFLRCNSLTSVTVPSGVISNLAFSECAKLASVVIGSGVKGLNNDAFGNCPSLTSVTFNVSLTSDAIGNHAFRNIGDLREKYFAEDEDNGTPGTYTRSSGSDTWTKQP